MQLKKNVAKLHLEFKITNNSKYYGKLFLEQLYIVSLQKRLIAVCMRYSAVQATSDN